MEAWIVPLGLGLNLFGAVVVGVADAWLSRALLVYLDAVEANVAKVAEAVRGGPSAAVTGIDIRRDRGQERARAFKMVGWLALVSGFALQVAAWFLRPPA